MLKRHRRVLTAAFFLLDLSILFLGALAAAYIWLSPKGWHLISFLREFKGFLLSYLFVWVFFAIRWRLYGSKRLTSFLDEARDVSKVTLLCTVFAAVPAFFLTGMSVGTLFLGYVLCFQLAGLIIFRFSLRGCLKYIRRLGYNSRRILLVGRNSRAAKFLERVAESPELGLETIGFVDSERRKRIGPLFSEYPFLGVVGDMERILRTHVVDEVLIFLPVRSCYKDIQVTLQVCESVGVEAKLPGDFFDLKLAKSTISMYGETPVINLYTSPRMGLQLIIKRLIDIGVSATLLLLLSPLFALVSFLIWATSPGPVFFSQQRLGYNGRLFECLKFRTMVANAEELKQSLSHLNEVSGPVFKIKNDPRITKIGGLLRKTSIDELPQLANVLEGDMSLVGPRPPLPNEVIQYDLRDLRRLSMKPGITCLWQVNGRSALAFEKWMELDREYIDHWSLWLDFKILAKTVPAVLKGSGAA